VEVVEGENYGFSGGFNSSLFDFGNTFRNSLDGAVVVMRPMHHIEFLKGLVPLIVGGRLPVHRRIHDETRGSPSLSNLT